MIKRVTELCIVVSSSLIQLHPIGPLSVLFSVLLVEASLEFTQGGWLSKEWQLSSVVSSHPHTHSTLQHQHTHFYLLTLPIFYFLTLSTLLAEISAR